MRKSTKSPCGNPERGVMRIVKDYNELDKLEPVKDGKVLVMYSNLIHQFIGGRWAAVGKLDKNEKIIYGRQLDEDAKR